MAGEYPGVFVLDYDTLVSRYGRERWHDEQKWLTVRLPIGAEFLNAFCSEWLRFLHPLCGRTGKVLVTDLDNTLWGGVVGEDGLTGIRLDGEYPGAAYRALQQAMLDLYRRGILLAIASKNNEPDAMQVFKEHRGMLLQPSQFSAMRINWRNKADNIREIAEELNVGLDSVVFLDDNPVERERVRRELPEVTVIELPADPMRYASTLRDVAMFERLTRSTEDSMRQEYYAQQRLRSELQRSSESLEGFYRSLRQVVEIEPLKAKDVARAAQLTHKTNQFNLTTKRHTEAQLARIASSPDWDVYAVRVLDRFGDNGLVGVCITNRSGDTCEIDTLLLSCRVIGRTVESAILFFLTEQSRAKGIKLLRGRYARTAKNQPAASFYPDHGFEKVRQASQDEDGMLWLLDLGKTQPACPDWIELRTEREAAATV
jgi:FkbH-like protein